MERNFKFEPGDGVGVRVYRAGEYAFLKLGQTVELPDGQLAFVLQRVSPQVSKNLFAVPASIIEEGGLCPGQEDGTVWEFPSPESYREFTHFARYQQGKIRRILERFDLRRLFRKK